VQFVTSTVETPIPDPPPLLEIHTHESLLFIITGVDFTRAELKQRIEGLPTCATTQAIHLEIVTEVFTCLLEIRKPQIPGTDSHV